MIFLWRFSFLVLSLAFVPLHWAWPATQMPSFDTSGTEKSGQAMQSLSAFEERTGCRQSSSEKSLLVTQKVLQVADRDRKKNFICEVSDLAQVKNQEVIRDREFMLSYIERTANGEDISKEDHIQMTEKLILYRLLRDNKGKEYYFPTTRYTPPSEIKRKIRNSAEQLVEESGPPAHCFFVKGNKVKKTALNSLSCRERIAHKIQAIPSPLIAAQAALESGWGGSSVAENYGNILGLQYKFNDPDSMPGYKNCRRAEKAPSRCLLNFEEGYRGSIHEYFARFNGSHLAGYQNYRSARWDLNRRNEDQDPCQKSTALANHIGFYAEDKKYIPHVKQMVHRICPLLRECEPEVITAQVSPSEFQKAKHSWSPNKRSAR